MELTENTTGPERAKSISQAFMFDIDGVLTNPDTKVVNERAVGFISKKLDKGEPVALFTGRAYEWADSRIIDLIRKQLSSPRNIDYLFVSGEHGAVTVNYKDGKPQIDVDVDLDLPEEVKTKAKEIVGKHEGVFYDPQKQTMISLEIEGGEDKGKVKREKVALDQIEEELRKLLEGNSGYKVQRTEIAVDVLNAKAGKRIASKKFLDFVREKGVVPSEYILFGDTLSDVEAADELAETQKKVRFVYVGVKEAPKRQYQVITSPNFAFDEAAEQILYRHFGEHRMNEPEFWGETFSILFMSPDGFELQTRESLRRDEKIPFDFPRREINELNKKEREFWEKSDKDVDPLRGRGFIPQVGLRSPHRDGNKITFDIKPVTFPTYSSVNKASDLSQLFRAMEIGSPAGTSMVLLTTEKDGSSKIILQHRGPNNRAYRDIPRASAAGMLDGKFYDVSERTQNRELRGRFKPVDTEFVKANIVKELEEEIGVKGDELISFKINALTQDAVRIHWEFTSLARTKLSVEDIKTRAERRAEKGETAHAYDFGEQFFVIDGTPEAIEKLLTEVKCPLPSTHVAGFMAAGYSLSTERDGATVAKKWFENLKRKVIENYRKINELSTSGEYDPTKLPQEQGLPSIETELTRVGLI